MSGLADNGSRLSKKNPSTAALDSIDEMSNDDLCKPHRNTYSRSRLSNLNSNFSTPPSTESPVRPSRVSCGYNVHSLLIDTPHAKSSNASTLSQYFHDSGGLLEDPVQSTTDDASMGKLAAVNAGYYEDPYLQYIVKCSTRSSPLINRGYYLRVAALRRAVAVFLRCCKSSSDIQIVNFGAGLDTLYFWLYDYWGQEFNLKVYEVDFSQVIAKKLHYCTRKKALWDHLSQTPGAQTIEQLHNQWIRKYMAKLNNHLTLIAADICNLDAMVTALMEAGFDTKLPTLFVNECVLAYIQAYNSNPLIAWCAQIMQASAAFVMYEQMNPYDSFGRTMIHNLEQRGCPLLSIFDYPTLESQKSRFLKVGWHNVTVADMNDIYNLFTDKDEIYRVQHLELLDEVEEWRLIQAHYFVLIAIKEPQCSQTSDHNQNSSLQELAQLWEPSSVIKIDLPRFTTVELKNRTSITQKDIFCEFLTLPTPSLAFLTIPDQAKKFLESNPETLAKVHKNALYFPLGRSWKMNPSPSSPMANFLND